jgi:hypothetical protein
MMKNKGVILLVEDRERFRRVYRDVLNAERAFASLVVKQSHFLP